MAQTFDVGLNSEYNKNLVQSGGFLKDAAVSRALLMCEVLTIWDRLTFGCKAGRVESQEIRPCIKHGIKKVAVNFADGRAGAKLSFVRGM